MQPQLIAGRYQVLRAIGRGGMGTVWLCRDEVLGREVAVKQIGALPGESATQTKRAMREARSAAALNHPNAVAVYDVVDHDGRPWLVMEYVEGQTLADEISRDGQLSPQRVADIGAQLAGALARAHERRIVHRDIKPGNVLIDKSGRPKISDFGIARGHGDDQLTQVGFITGTPGYLSPELARGGDPHSASDVWALGATLYTAVEGRPPYETRSNPIATLRAIASERPRPMTCAGALGPAIDAMMHEDPTCRWDMATCARRLAGIARAGALAMPRLDRDATKVFGAPLPESTQRHPSVPPPGESTQRHESVPPPGESTQRHQSVAAPVARPPVESTQRMEASARPEPEGPRELHGSAAVPRPDSRRNGRRRLPLALLALLVVVFGGVFLMNQLGDPNGTNAVPGKAAVTAPAKATATAAPRTSESPTTTAPATTAAATTAPTADPSADKKLESFVKSYYSDVTKDTDRTWVQLSPTMQGAARGRSGYDDFWGTIAKVRVNQVTANAVSNSAVANLTFTSKNGATSTENHTLTFVTAGEGYLIESDRLG